MGKKIIAIVIVFIVTITGYFTFRFSYRENVPVLGYGTIEAREIHVGSRIGGRVEKVNIRESDYVKKDQELISLESKELRARKKQAQAELKGAEAEESKLQEGYRRELIKKAEAQLEEQIQYLQKAKEGARPLEIKTQKRLTESALAKYKHAEREYRRQQNERNNISERDLDQSKRAWEMAEAQYNAERNRLELLEAGSRAEDIAIAMQRKNQAEAELERLKAGPRPQEKEQARAKKEALVAQLEMIEVQLAECTIRTPTEGRVEICDLEPGDITAPGRTAVTLLKPNDLWVKIFIKEFELDRVKVGQEVEIIVETSKQKKQKALALRFLHSLVEPKPKINIFQGKIVHIASQAEFTPRNVQTKEERGNQVFAVKVAINRPVGFLRPGISVVVQEKSSE